jgi:DNA-binding NarL/FixJ family response regulator
MIQRAGFPVCRRCLGGIAANRPNVALLDLHLPKVSGMEVLSSTKADERARSIAVVVPVSSKEGRNVAESSQLRVNSFISNPVGLEALANVVSELGLYRLLINRPSI